MISVAIDGPSGAGKSTISDILAKKYNLLHVDTGALYRTVGLYTYRCEKDPTSESDLTELLKTIDMNIGFENGKQIMYLSNQDVSQEIRTNIISSYASKVSALPVVRKYLLDTQRNLAKKYDVIMDGRDIGTVILPNADIKIFLTVNDDERAKRRYLELVEKGESITLDEVRKSMAERDKNDSSRALAPLKPAEDAIFIDNSNSIEHTVNEISKLIEKIKS